MKTYIRAIPLLLTIAALGLRLHAEESKLLNHETFMEMESLSDPRISPAGDRIVFTRRWVDQKADRFASNLWIVDVNGERVRELTHGSWRDSSPVWSPQGDRIAFLSDRDGTDQIHVLWVESGEVAQLTHLERGPSGLAWSPDGSRLVFTQFVPDDEKLLPVKLPKRPEGAKWAEPAIVIDRLNWRRDGRGPVPAGHSHVFLLDARLGGTPRRLTDGEYDHSDPEFSADGETLFVTGIRKPDAEYLRNDSEIYAISVANGEIRTLTSRKGPDRGAKVSPDGKWIAYTGYDERGYTSHLSSVYLMDTEGGSQRLLSGGLPNSPGELQWATDSSGLYFLLAEKGSANLQFVGLDGSRRAVTDQVQVLDDVSVSKKGLAAALRSSFQQPATLVTFPLNEPGKTRELVDVNQDVLAGVRLGKVEELWFKSSDGLPIQGWLIQPADFKPGKKYPMVLWIHGGPWSMYSVAFNWDFQNFAAEGYALLYLNPRGSTGYGQDFVNGIQNAYPGKDYDDLMAGVDAALAKGWIDENNLFVCGGSGGGVLTAWIVGHTNRFRAAVSMRPVINWHSFVGTTDSANWYRQFQKYPWQDPMEYAVRSPLHYVDNVTTPTMVMTGEADLRTPIGQSEEYYRALKVLKKETLLVRMPGEFHGWRRPSHRLLQQLYLQAWFGKHMKTQDSGQAPEAAGKN